MTFNLLHLSLVREYTQIEFAMDGLGIDFERVIDDWVLLLYLVGNDFIPHLPNLHIDKGGLPMLFAAYKRLLSAQAGPRYLHDGGKLDVHAFQTYMRDIAAYDLEYFEENNADLKYLDSKMATFALDGDESTSGWETEAVLEAESPAPDHPAKGEAEGEGEEDVEGEFIVVQRYAGPASLGTVRAPKCTIQYDDLQEVQGSEAGDEDPAAGAG